MTPIEIAEARARRSENPPRFMLAYSAGWNAAADGGDVEEHARMVGIDPNDAGFIEGVAAWRARAATSRDYMPGSPAHINHTRGARA
ncbi:hypothetical protein ACIQ7D_18115 [Streptomyces sp. NPDC096310]|uniref:hypothetical protein n=1 Tax=Streptomyces sp. NPDC096310 TaxID=3366082 RepID=UPI0038200111